MAHGPCHGYEKGCTYQYVGVTIKAFTLEKSWLITINYKFNCESIQVRTYSSNSRKWIDAMIAWLNL